MPGLTNPTDFNDLAALAGLDDVAAAIAAAAPVDPPARRDTVPPWPEMSDSDIAYYRDEPSPTDTTSAEPQPWPEPSIPGVLKTPDIPCSILPGIWGEFAQAVSDNTQTPPAIAVLAALGVLATLLQGRYEIDLKSHREVLALWCVSVSASGTRKSAVMGEFQAPPLHWEKLLRDRKKRDIVRNEAIRSTTLKRIEGLKQAASKAKGDEIKAIRADIEAEELAMPDVMRAPILFTEDTTPETMQRLVSENGGRMAALSDEPGLFRILGGLYSKGGASLDIFLKGHVGSSLKVERESRSVFVSRPCISLSLMIQPDIVADLAGSNQFRASGLMARFFYAVPVSNVGKRDVRQRHIIPMRTREAYEAAVFDLLADYPPEAGADTKPKALYLDNLAEEAFLDFSQEIEDQQGEGGAFDAIRDWTSKLPGSTARVAALLELAATGLHATTVSLESMHQAIKLARLLLPHTRAAFGLLGADAVDADLIAVLKWIRCFQLKEFTQREAQKAMEHRFKTVDKLKKALDALKARDCIRVETKKPTTGRPSTVIRVNPLVLSMNSVLS